MKTNPLKTIIIVCITILCSSTIYGQNTTRWDYPVKPGTREWKQIKTVEDRISACQIPEDRIKSISTKDLIEVCVDYPLYYSVISAPNIIEGINKVSNEFNGFNELISRNDCQIALLNKYKQFTIAPKQLTESQKKELVENILRMELVILYCAINDTGNNTLAEELLTEAYKKYKAKKNNPVLFSSFSYQLPLYIVAKSLSEDYKTEFILLKTRSSGVQKFMQTCNLPSGQDEIEIVNLAKNYLTDKFSKINGK